jgi:hypothetical protein
VKRTSLALVVFIAGLAAEYGHAQNWVAFVPPERDFRVLFPAPPVRSTAADGSIVFKSTFENDDNSVDYVVHRLPPSARQISDAQNEIRRRVETRARDDDQVQLIQDSDYGPDWGRHIFRHRRTISIHRLAGNPGRYYELEVILPRGRAEAAIHTARDFIDSFQITGVSIPASGIPLEQRLASWCKNRSDSFSRTFCEYSVCIQPDYEKHPHCKALVFWR